MDLFKVDIQAFIKKKLSELEPIKLQLSAFAFLVKPIEETKVSCHGSSNAKAIVTEFDVSDYYSMVDQMVSTLQVFCSSGSGFIVSPLEHLVMNINLYKPIRGSSYLATLQIFFDNDFSSEHQKQGSILLHLCNIGSIESRYCQPPAGSFSLQASLCQLDFKDFDFPMAIRDILCLRRLINYPSTFLALKITKFLHSTCRKLLPKPLMFFFFPMK